MDGGLGMAQRRSPCRGLRLEPLEDRVLLSASSPAPASDAIGADLRTAWLNHLQPLQLARLAGTTLTTDETPAERLSPREREDVGEDRIEHERRDGQGLLSLLPQTWPAGKEAFSPPGPQVPAARVSDLAGPVSGPAIPPGPGPGIALPVGVVSVPPGAREASPPEVRAPIGKDAVAAAPQPAADPEPEQGTREGDFVAEAGPPLAGLLRLDLKPLCEGVDALFERLGALGRPGEATSPLGALGPWLLVAGAVAGELALLPGLLRQDRRDEGPALPGGRPLRGDET